MSSVWRATGARCCVLLVAALTACSGSGSGDLFTPSTGTGSCDKCGSSGAAGGGEGGTTSSSSATAGGSAATGSTTTTTAATGGGGAGGASATTGGAGTTGGSSVGGTAGTSGGGSGVEDSGVTPVDDAAIDIVGIVDSGHADRAVDAVADHATCVPTGIEICDGIDNNCNGGIDENNVCRTGCVGATFNGVGYMFCHGMQDRIWSEARTDCTSHGMHLIRVDDAEQNAFIRKTGLSVGYTDPIWIGASDLAREGTWVWTDGTQFWQGGVAGHTVNGHFAAWDMDQPNSADGPEDCAAVWTNIETWHDVNCAVRHAYMCQAPAPIR